MEWLPPQSATLGWLVLCRVAPLVWWRPLFGGAWLPPSTKLALCLALSAALWPSAWAHAPTSWADPLPASTLFLASFQEILLGSALALVISQTFWAVELAGGLLDRSAALSDASSAPDGEARPPFAAWLAPLTVALFVGAGGLPLVVAALARSWRAWPPLDAAAPLDLALLERWALGGVEVLALGLALAFPGIAARWMAEWGLALAQRAAPRLAELLSQASLRAAWVLLVVTASLWGIVELALSRAWASASLWEDLLRGAP